MPPARGARRPRRPRPELDLFPVLIDRLADALFHLPAEYWDVASGQLGAGTTLAERLQLLGAIRSRHTEEEDP